MIQQEGTAVKRIIGGIQDALHRAQGNIQPEDKGKLGIIVLPVHGPD